MTLLMKSSLGYLCLMLILFLATFAMNMQEKTAYASFLVLFNCVEMSYEL
tara:strand:- start:5420 stop:5569 length:150 start_codon:yes stop_codon:yes gene_type:complete